MSKKRSLTDKEIDEVLSFIKPNPHIPSDVAEFILEQVKADMIIQLKEVEIFPVMIPELSKQLQEMYIKTIIEPGESVGIIMAQSIGEKQTQKTLNSFHTAGSADKKPVDSQFSELLNATNNPKNPSYTIYLNPPQTEPKGARKLIGKDLVHLTCKRISKSFDIFTDNPKEEWYEYFYELYTDVENPYNSCLRINLDMDILYEYKLEIKEIAEAIRLEFNDIYIVFSPDSIGVIDVFVDTDNITLPKDLPYITEENKIMIYLEEVVQPILENLTVCGIPGIQNHYILKHNNQWIVETENEDSKEKKVKSMKTKPFSSSSRFKKLLSQDFVDISKTTSNNIWDIYYTLGIEATRAFMIEQQAQIMDGINKCHIMLLVDKMTFTGTITSISRYAMKNEESGPFGKASFEETLDNFMNAGVYGEEEPTKGVSASVICGKMAYVGTGVCSVSVNMDKLLSVPE